MEEDWILLCRWKSWKFIKLPFRLSFLYPHTKKNNNQYPTILSPTPFVEHTQKSWICLFKIKFCSFNILLIVPDFFLIIKATKQATLKCWNWFCGKKHHSCEVRCLIFTTSQLSIAGVIMGHVPFLAWTFLGQWGKSKAFIFKNVHVHVEIFKEFRVFMCFCFFYSFILVLHNCMLSTEKKFCGRFLCDINC